MDVDDARSLRRKRCLEERVALWGHRVTLEGMMRVGWLLVLVACAHEPIDAPPPAPPTPPKTTRAQVAPIAKVAPVAKRAQKTLSPAGESLAGIDMFAIGGIGFAGATSRGEELTLALAKEPDAIAAFDEILQRDNPAAQLYAYWALRTLDPALAAKHRAALAKDTSSVSSMSGCIGFDETVQKLAGQIETNYQALRR
jgi:hypothetical protein